MLRRRPFVGSGFERPGPTAWTRDEIGSLCVDAAPVPRPPYPVSRIPSPVPAPVSCATGPAISTTLSDTGKAHRSRVRTRHWRGFPPSESVVEITGGGLRAR